MRRPGRRPAGAGSNDWPDRDRGNPVSLRTPGRWSRRRRSSPPCAPGSQGVRPAFDAESWVDRRVGVTAVAWAQPAQVPRRPRSLTAARFPAKNEESSSPHSSARSTVDRQFVVEAGVGAQVVQRAAGPARGSVAPKTNRPTRAATSAPAHIGHGSSVTTSSPGQPPPPEAAAVSRSANISACAVGSPDRSRSLWRAATTGAVERHRADRHLARGRGRAPRRGRVPWPRRR